MLRLRAEPEISGDTPHSTGKCTPEERGGGLCPTAVGPRSVPASLPAPPVRRQTPPGIEHEPPALQFRRKETRILPQSFTRPSGTREGDMRSAEGAERTGREKKDSSCCVKEREVPARLHAFLGARCGRAPAEPRTCRHVSARASARAQQQPRLAKAAPFPPGGPPGAGGRAAAAAPRGQCKWPHPPLSPSSSARHPGDWLRAGREAGAPQPQDPTSRRPASWPGSLSGRRGRRGLLRRLRRLGLGLGLLGLLRPSPHSMSHSRMLFCDI